MDVIFMARAEAKASLEDDEAGLAAVVGRGEGKLSAVQGRIGNVRLPSVGDDEPNGASGLFFVCRARS